MTTSQVAAVLDVSVRTLHRYMDDGLIAPIGTVGLGYLFDEREVAKLRRQLLERHPMGGSRKETDHG